MSPAKLVKELVARTLFVTIGCVWAVPVLLSIVWTAIKTKGASLVVKERAEPSISTDTTYGEHQVIKANGLDFHCVVKGEGKLMLFLHGFPEFWYSWKNQLVEFAKDYKVVAVDMRGYGLSSRPQHRDDYTMDKLSLDVVSLIKALGYEECILVSHDWGGVIAWNVAANYSQHISKLVVMNAPHGKALKLNISFKQFMKSWYIFLFQLPFIAELMVKSNDCGFLRGAFKSVLTPDEIEYYKHNISRPGAATAMLSYYRCLPWQFANPARTKVNVKTLVIWGEDDIALDKSLNNNLERFVPNVTLHFIPGANHWVQQHKPKLVNEILRNWLQAEESL